MTTRALERVDDWETRSYTGGYRGVHELAEQEFSGVVRAGMATLCMLNGTAVGVLDGTIEDFEEADGTAYVAPTPALPLLAVMQDRSDEVRGKYYTEDTPLSKVDRTLEDGGFTGFVELSENVLSGDYYVVYHGGRSMSVAFVGERGQLLAEQEAFERADDEVGIYEVRPVEIDVIDVPEPEPEPTSSASAVGASTEDSAADGAAADSGAVEDAEPADTDAAEETDTGDDTDDEPTDESADGTTDRDSTGEPPAQVGDTAEETVSEPDSDTTSGDNGTDDWASGGGSTGVDSASRATADGVEASSRAQADEAETDERTGTDRPTTETRQSADSDRARSRTDETGQTTETRSTTEQADSTDEPSRSTDRSPAPAAEPRTAGSTDVGGQRTEQSSSNHPGAKASSSDRPSGTADGRRRTESAGDASDLEIRTIPSLDPTQSWGADEDGPRASTVPVPSTDSSASTASHQRLSESRSDRTSSGERSPSVEEQSTKADRPAPSESNGRSTPETDETHKEANGTGAATGQPEDAGGTTETTDERVAALEETIEEREARIDDLEARVENAESKRDELEAERDELETERDQLREELSTVRSELQSLKEERDALEAQLDGLDVGTDGIERRLSRQEAIEGTNLFVRYGSKSAPTLAAARESGASQSDVKENISVEYHTQFEVDGTLVEGQPFEEFLEATMEHQFVTWAVTELLFEIRDTGHREALADLYDALPHVDRVELNGSVGVEFDEDGQTKRAQESFDVVFRDRMGNPLLVANMNDSRQAATENQMNSLVTAATRVGDTSDSLAGAMFVTSSFFEPAALETTADATGGGLLSRDKRESFVKLSRKQGYHLCLVEARDDQFHMAVPEL